MADQSSYVNVEKGAFFACTARDGGVVVIGDQPVAVDAHLAAYLDSVPFVKRAGSTVVTPDPDGEEEEA